MNTDTMSLSEIRKAGLEVLARELGTVGMIRFLYQYEKMSGDYTLERESWQRSESVDSLVDKIKRSKHKKKE